MAHYRAQFQTSNGRTYAVVDDQPITIDRLRLVEALVSGRACIDGPVPPLIDLAATPPAWLRAAELARTA
jgi:hypothetical protein